MADQKKLHQLKKRLCSLAYSKRKGLNPGACHRCEVPCEYGRQLLALLEMDPPLRATEPLYAPIRPQRNTRILNFMNKAVYK